MVTVNPKAKLAGANYEADGDNTVILVSPHQIDAAGLRSTILEKISKTLTSHTSTDDFIVMAGRTYKRDERVAVTDLNNAAKHGERFDEGLLVQVTLRLDIESSVEIVNTVTAKSVILAELETQRQNLLDDIARIDAELDAARM